MDRHTLNVCNNPEYGRTYSGFKIDDFSLRWLENALLCKGKPDLTVPIRQ